MNIDDMKAGPEMDRMVARLMGVHVEKHASRDRWHLIIPGGVNQIDFTTPEAPWSACPPYSTNIVYAWGVAERFGISVIKHRDGYLAGVLNEDSFGTFISKDGVVDGCLDPCAFALVPTLAICRAALKAQATAPADND